VSNERSLPGSVRGRLSSIVSEAEKLVADKERLHQVLKERRRPRQKPKPSRPKAQDESFKDLDAFLEEARAGMPDEALARAANVSMAAVLLWRKARDLKRKKGWERRKEMEIWAVDAFGDGYVSDIQALQSEVKGIWDLPEYVLRKPLEYDQLTRALYFLHVEMPMPIDSLASAFGLRERDVEMAIAIELAHLERVSRPCAVCGKPTDPAYGKTCSARCAASKT
jgi:hypothetical protein